MVDVVDLISSQTLSSVVLNRALWKCIETGLLVIHPTVSKCNVNMDHIAPLMHGTSSSSVDILSSVF